MLMNDLMFVPIKQEYYPEPHKIYEVIFRLGFTSFALHLMDVSKVKTRNLVAVRKRQVAPEFEYIKDRYMCILTIGEAYWIWHSTNNPEIAETQFKEVQHILQRGDSFIFKHLGGINKPVRLSWRAIEFEW